MHEIIESLARHGQANPAEMKYGSPRSSAIIVMPRQAVAELTEQGAPAFRSCRSFSKRRRQRGKSDRQPISSRRNAFRQR